MNKYSRRLAVLSVAAAVLLPVTAAQAQWYEVAPAWQPAPLYPYAVERSYVVEVTPDGYGRRRHGLSHDYPYVCLSCGWSRPRYIDETQSVVGRRYAVEGGPVPSHDRKHGDTGKRTIHADAEITILGPDRMTIRLSRKPGASAKAGAQ